MKDNSLTYKKWGLIFAFILGMLFSGAIGGLFRNREIGQLIPLTETDLKDMGKGKFDIQPSAEDKDFVKDPNGFISPAMGFKNPIQAAYSPRTAVHSSWDIGNGPSLLFKCCLVPG